MTGFDLPPGLLEIFAEESQELIQGMTAAALGLEDGSVEVRAEALDRLRRHLHTMKGSAGSIGLDDVSRLCHKMEDRLLGLDVAAGIDAGQADLIHRAVSAIQAGCAGDPSASIEMTTAELSRPSPAAAFTTRELASPEPPPAAPPEAKAEDGPERPEEQPAKKPEAPAAAPQVPASNTIRIAVDKLDALHSTVGELVVTRLQAAAVRQDFAELQRDMATVGQRWRELSSTIRSLRSELSPAHWRSLESQLGTFGGDLREVEKRAFHLNRRGATHDGQLRVVSESLEEGLKRARMLPLSPFFESFAISVREAARSCGVQARLDSMDRGIEVDRMVLERMREPLLHIVRNAVAHGIESPATRQAERKPPAGTITLGAERQSGYVVIRVADDGRGIDREAVRRRGLSMGVLRTDEVLDDERLVTVLCTPGFSTADITGQIAGRGIGLDVAAEVVHRLHGSISIESRPGEGTVFLLRVPASVTTTQGMLLEVGPYRFGLPLEAVERVMHTRRSQISTLEDVAVIYINGDPLTITSLGDLVGALEHAPPDNGSPSPALVLHLGSRRLANIVDDLPGELPMVVRPLGAQFETVPWLSGAAVQSDGSVLPVLDPRGLMDIAGKRRRTVARAPTRVEPAPLEAPAKKRLKILVVDDSLTMRTLHRNILEAADQDVVVAADGIEAKERLRTTTGIDLVVTDLDMPRMDGFALCRWIRASQFSDLPVLMVTSMDSDEEKRLGLAAGADAYIIKGNFRQDHFLATIRRLGGL